MKTCRRVCVRGALITSTPPEDSWRRARSGRRGGPKEGRKGEERTTAEERDEGKGERVGG